MHFHDLRYTFATLMLSRNVHPKVVQEMLGHANVAITLDRYSHFLPGMDRDAAQAMDEIFAQYAPTRRGVLLPRCCHWPRKGSGALFDLLSLSCKTDTL